jgi:hypothetical protein
MTEGQGLGNSIRAVWAERPTPQPDWSPALQFASGAANESRALLLLFESNDFTAICGVPGFVKDGVSN